MSYIIIDKNANAELADKLLTNQFADTILAAQFYDDYDIVI